MTPFQESDDLDYSEKDIQMAEFVTVAKISDIEPGQIILVEVEDEDVAIASVNGEYYAFSAECPHAGGPLDEGEVEGNVVVCPWHGAEFDMATGEALTMPASDSIATYQVRVDGEEIQVSSG